MDIGRVIQEITQRKAQHESRSQELGNQMLMVEQQLEGLADQRQQHLGAMGACQYMLQVMQQAMQSPPSAPSYDPDAESDQ